MSGPFTDPPVDGMVVSPLGVVPKKEKGKFRLIHHLSFPKGGSVNDGIDRELSSVAYTSFDFALAMVREAGPGALMGKTDIEAAFRLLPVHPENVECARPGRAFENGKYDPVLDNYFVGSTLHYDCYDGFRLFGSKSRTCQENGKWSGKTAICDSEVEDGYCPNPGLPIGTTKDSSDYRIGHKVTYKCLPGLKMFGSKERICRENLIWTGTEPSCRYPYTYDTPQEVAENFASSLSETIESSDPDRREGTEFRNLKVKKGGLMNIFILLDASSSVGEGNFEMMKNLTETFIYKVSSYEFIPRFSILTYGSRVKTIVTITDDESTDTDEIVNHLKMFSYDEHTDKRGTNTRAALREVYNQLSLFKLRNENIFYNTSNVIVLMTDGKSNMGGSPILEVNNIKSYLNIRNDNNRDDKLDIYVFGLTKEINDDEINDIASKKPKETHVFKMQNITQLKEAFDKIIDDTEAFEMCGLSKEKSYDKREMFPWIAQIVIVRDKPESCTGSILTRNFILTAAHCFRVTDKIESISVELEKKQLKVKNIISHPEYKPDSKRDKNIHTFFAYDLALVELQKPLKFDSTISDFSSPEQMLLSRDQVEALFISKTTDQHYVKLDVRIKQDEKRHGCLEDAKNVPELLDVKNIEEAVTDNFLCTGQSVGVVEPQTCKGDSGGPLIIEYKNRYIQLINGLCVAAPPGKEPTVQCWTNLGKVGVISWGTVDSCEKYERKTIPLYSRDFHVNVFKAIDWIKEILKDEL
ncbi:complement factor B-like [Gastrophryne carolinensis]